MRRPLVFLLGVAIGSCTRGPKQQQAGGVTVEERGDGMMLKGGTLSIFVSEPASALSIAPWPERPPILIEASVGDTKRRLIDRSVVTENGVAAIRHRIEGTDAELLLTVDAKSAIVLRARAPRLAPHAKLAIHLGVERRHPIVLDRGGPFDEGEAIADRSAYVVLATTVLASPTGLLIHAEKELSAVAAVTAPASGPVEVAVKIATAASTREASLLGGRLAGVAPRTQADIVLDSPVPVRVWIDGKPKVPGPPMVLDPARDAERTVPIIDATAKRTLIKLPEGHWTLRATHGLGYSVVRRELDVVAGDTLRVKLPIVEETARPEWIGCDFHVHARPSFDATTVSYEERVRSLVAVGVECAAATEHDHIGDHGPAAAALHLDDRFRALTGVELTTVAPQFGHFNVYPWPVGAKVPQVGATTPSTLFRAIRALPGSFIFQVNHPRMRDPGSSIGYFDYVALNAHTGVAKGPYTYHRDYDALEVFNGYDLKSLDKVRELTKEWIELLDRGEVHVATGSSDSHGISFPWAGFPRTMVFVGAAWRMSGRSTDGIVDALKHGRAYVSSGPLVDLRVDDAMLGDTVAHPAKIRVSVPRTSWLGAPKVDLLLGPEPLPATVPHIEGEAWVIEVLAPVVTRKRPLVAIVESPLIGDALGLTGFDRALAITNPIWITP